MSEPGDVIHGFIMEQRFLTAEPCQKENLFATSHRQKMAAKTRRQSRNSKSCGNTQFMLIRLPEIQRCLMIAVI